MDNDVKDYILRLDLSRNLDFLNEMAFHYLVNSFITYCADILAVAALGSPEQFDLKVRIQASELARQPSKSRIMREVAISVISQINFMSYPELRRLLLSKVKLTKTSLSQLNTIDHSVEKRNRLTHGLGVSRLAIDIHKSGKWQKREKVTERELSAVWNAIAKTSKTIDKLIMKNYDVWKGVDICAPGLYRNKNGERILRENA